MDACCGEACLAGADDGLLECICQSIATFDACVAKNCGPIPGRCAITHDCVNDCRVQQSNLRAGCLLRVQKNIKAPRSSGPPGCGPCKIGMGAARRVARACFDDATAKREDCPDLPQGTAATCDDTGDDGSDDTGGDCDDTADPHNCQKACIGSIVGDCYSDCNEACGGDSVARRICRQGCRNAECATIKKRCTCHGDSDDEGTCTATGGVSGAYSTCCVTDSGCRTALGPNVQCVPTTTLTTTTRTTTSTTTTNTSTTTTTTTMMP